MRVLQVHTRYRQAGGEDAVVRAEAALLRAGGHDVVTYEVDNPGAPAAAVTALAVSAWNPAAAAAVADAARRAQATVAHVHNTWFALSPAVFPSLRRAGLPVVATLHNYRLLCTNGLLYRDGRPCEDCVGTHPWRGVWHRCYRDSAAQSALVAGMLSVARFVGLWERDVDLFLALTEFARQRFIAGGLAPEKLMVKPNTVADPGPRPRRPSASKTILFVGRLTEEKGVGSLLKVWSKVRLEGFELLVVGDGPLRPLLQRDFPPGVRLLGALPPEQVSRLMLEARVLAFPSRWYEGLPLVIIEAMAAGLPVLASELGSSPELLENDQAWLVPPESADAWGSAMLRLADDSFVDRAGLVVRNRYERAFSPAVGLRALEEAYGRAISAAQESGRGR